MAKDAKKKKEASSDADGLTLASHPRASEQIDRIKGMGALAAFALVGLLSYRAGAPLFDSALRALVAGMTGYMAAWYVAVVVWRHLAVAEMRAARAPVAPPRAES